MIAATVTLIGKFLLILVLLGGVVVTLLAIGHLLHTDDLNTLEDDKKLKEEVDNEETVVGDKSVFYRFLVKDNREEEKNKVNKK